VPVGDDGVCVQEAIQPASQAIAAWDTCKAQGAGARICTYADMQQACSPETLTFRNATANWPFNATFAGWLGDHGLAAGGDTDDEYLTWNVPNCSGNADGAVRATDQATLPFRCCY
jgi:hypothetical protein